MSNFESTRSSAAKVKRHFPCFSCKEDSKNRYLINFWSSNIQTEEELQVLYTPSPTLFEKTVTLNTLWKDSASLFMEIKKNCHYVQAFLDYSQNSSLSNLEKSRNGVCEALFFILSKLKDMQVTVKEKQCTNVPSISEMLSTLMKELVKLLFFVGPVGNLCNIPITDLIELTNSDFYHRIHLYLDVWCNVLILFQIINGFPVNIDNMQTFSDEVDHGNLFIHVSVSMITDIICIALKAFKSMNELYITSPFFCKCIQDVWILLINVLDAQSTNDNDSFWSYYFRAVQKVHSYSLKDKVQEEEADIFTSINLEETSSENIIEGILWVTSYLAPLYRYDHNGTICDGKSLKSCYDVLKFLINLLLTAERKEKVLRHSLYYVQHLTSLWEPNPKFLYPLIDFFIRKVDENFSLSRTGLEGMSCLYKNAVSWYNFIDSLSAPCKTSEGETSYDLFIRLLHGELSKSSDKIQAWRTIKGRIYCKFSNKKVKELTEIGLQNSFSMFLAFGKSGQIEACDTIIEFASVVEATSNPKKQAVAWKTLFVLIYLHQKKPIKLDKVILHLTKFFDSACSQCSLINKDSILKANVMNLLMMYVDNVNDIFELSQYSNMLIPQLIAPGFSILLNSCSTAEINYILGVLVSILNKVQTFVKDKVDAECDISETHVAEVLKQFLTHIYRSLKNIATINASSVFVADIAAALTTLTFRCTVSESQNDFSSIFMSFSRDSINSVILCRYLCFLFDDEQVLMGLKESIPEMNYLMFQCWLKCIIYMEPPDDQIKELTKKVLLQKDIIECFPDVKNLDFTSSDHVTISLAFFQTMKQTYEKIDLQQRHQLKLKLNHYFKTLATCVVSRITKQCDSKTLGHVYKIVSHLVEFCAPLLYRKFEDATILSNLLDKTLIPKFLYPKDPKFQAILVSSVKTYLPNILRGLFYLDYKKDSCIDRQIKNAIKNYALVYTSAKNPFTKLLLDTANARPEGLKPETFEFLLETIRRVVGEKDHPKVTFEILFEVLQSSSLGQKKIVADHFLKCVFEVYMKQENVYANYLKNMLKKIFTYFRDKIDLDASKSFLTPTIEWLIRETLQRKLYQKCFSILDIGIDHFPLLICDIVGTLTKTVEEVEKKWGGGEGVIIRSQLSRTISKLQQKLSTIPNRNNITFKTEV